MPDGDKRILGTKRERKPKMISVYVKENGVWKMLRDVPVEFLPAFTVDLVAMRYSEFMFKKPGKYSAPNRDKVIEASVIG